MSDETPTNWKDEHRRLAIFFQGLTQHRPDWEISKDKGERTQQKSVVSLKPARSSDSEMFKWGNCSPKPAIGGKEVGTNVDIMYPTDKFGEIQAKKVCHGCPVKGSCLNYALENPDLTTGGVYGGTTDEERKPLRGGIAHGLIHPLSLPAFDREPETPTTPREK